MLSDVGSSLRDIIVKDHFQVELADLQDTKEEIEEVKEEKLRARFTMKYICVASTKNRIAGGMLSYVDLQSLYNPEIITPPPELL